MKSFQRNLQQAALDYHREAPAGKLAVFATKPLSTQRDLSLAYSPGVAAACQEIVKNADAARMYTTKGNLIAVISDGSAVLGLGNIGPLASKPVMEGKAVLFKKFAGIDVFDIELATSGVEHFVETVAALEPTFGGINLEDIRAPFCFEVEEALRRRLRIPVFHDDQHGTAIIVCAAIRNSLLLSDKKASDLKLVTSGAGAAALACLDLLMDMGLKRENIWVTDTVGVVYEGRKQHMNRWKALYAQKTSLRSLDEVVKGADILLGLSAGRVFRASHIRALASNPLVLALANPVPEIMPEEVKSVRKDAFVCTGRSDLPNQVNNVLCFPYIFRGALDVAAKAINRRMKLACVEAISDLARAPMDEMVVAATSNTHRFGADYLIPSPFDPRLILHIAPKVARAAMESGLARKPIADFDRYCTSLEDFVFRSGTMMKPIVTLARRKKPRLIYAEGEDTRTLQAMHTVLDEGLASPILIGRPEVIMQRLDNLGIDRKPGRDFAWIDPHRDSRFSRYWQTYHRCMRRKGVPPNEAREVVRTEGSVIACLSLLLRDADCMLCGLRGPYRRHLHHIADILGMESNSRTFAALSLVILPKGSFFLADIAVNSQLCPEVLVETTLLAVRQVRQFGKEPKVAFLSHSTFGSDRSSSAKRMREAVSLLQDRIPNLEVDGEMQAEVALDEDLRRRILPDTRLSGVANLLIFPNLDAANISHSLLKVLGEGVSVGPVLIGAAYPAHVLNSSATVRDVVNMSAVAAAGFHDPSAKRKEADDARAIKRLFGERDTSG